jgi:radical SAM superfamily enzyme YgiQ (UPF0313 family)
VKRDTPNILLINPWIYDFAAYDFWSKPMGLLLLASILKDHGVEVTYIDCLDRFHPSAPQKDPYARYGRGPYLKTRVPKPAGLEDLPRNYCRYGILPEWLHSDLTALPEPDLVLITSLMTYWYPGVQHTIAVTKEMFPQTPMVLGGIYATLCHEHAVKYAGADRVMKGNGVERILELVEAYTGFAVKPNFDAASLDTYPYPAFGLQTKIGYVPLLTSTGCPFACTYCASHFLNAKRMLRSPASVMEEIKYWHAKHGVQDFVFYDDALLVDSENHALPLFEKICAADLKIRFHTPNAVHIREISKPVADLMVRAGFKTLRLGLETATFENRNTLDRKVRAEEFVRAVSCLLATGFQSHQIGAYLLVGLPGQSLRSIEASIETVKQTCVTPVLAHYTPIPHTGLWKHAVESSRYDLESDPLFTNNAILPCRKEPFSWHALSNLKQLTVR